MPVPYLRTDAVRAARLFAIAVGAAIALGACQARPPAPPPLAPAVPDGTVPTRPLTENKPSFLTLPNIPADHTPVRVGILLPFDNNAPGVKALAAAMLKSAQLALYEGGNKDVVLMTADEGTTPETSQAAAVKLLDQGAEILLGPLFAPAVKAISAEARDRGVPVLAFSTDKSVAGDGIFLLSFQPENDVKRVIAFAAAQGLHKFAALSAETPYGDVTIDSFKAAVVQAKGEIVDVERFANSADAAIKPAQDVAKTDADAVFIPLGGQVLRAVSPTLGASGLDPKKVKLLGTSLWSDAGNLSEPTLTGGWFAAPSPDDDDAFIAKYKAAYGVNPPQLAALSFDAVSLVALLAKGPAYKRFTRAALTDPNGFAGVDGIFRFLPDGTAERGLAVIAVTPSGFHEVDPAPKTFVKPGT
ncbi:MAG TPA: penicillin-binding protein activator [Rhizomicrobium sp.]|nr:penicillin-binding protein activator [Rhizomicrobium sp.]